MCIEDEYILLEHKQLVITIPAHKRQGTAIRRQLRATRSSWRRVDEGLHSLCGYVQGKDRVDAFVDVLGRMSAKFVGNKL